jgi:glycosyltransferase involved in cell wall biosynthesis
MAGPDETGLRPQLESLAQRLGIAELIYWTGMLTGDSKWGALFGAEAFILPSHQENFGIAVADALSCGLIPLISDKINIAKDLDSEGAALVEPDSLDGTRRLLERFLALTLPAREQMRQRGLNCYRSRYSLANTADELYRAMGLG